MREVNEGQILIIVIKIITNTSIWNNEIFFEPFFHKIDLH